MLIPRGEAQDTLGRTIIGIEVEGLSARRGAPAAPEAPLPLPALEAPGNKDCPSGPRANA